jgi:hypothetical protein
MTEPYLVEVKLDPSLRAAQADPAPKTERAALAWPFLDTAYNLLREAAVRLALHEVRKQAAEQGFAMPGDEELFAQAKESGELFAPTSYMDLAPDDEMAALSFHGVFSILADKAMEDAVNGLNG